MGNTASSESGADSSDKEEKTISPTSTMENTASDEPAAAFSHEEAKSFNVASISHNQVCGPSLRPEVLRRSLRERGLCVGESDLKDALAKHSTILE